MTNNIYPCLWFDGQASEAADYYCSIFPHSSIISVTSIAVSFELNGRKFLGLNGKSKIDFTQAISFVIDCESQNEIDYYWDKLTANGGQEGNCGWLKDKFGISWQIVPTVLPTLLSDPLKVQKTVDALMKMKKLNINTLENA